MKSEMCYLNAARKYSNGKLKAIKHNLSQHCGPICVVTVGSFARREATSQSDLDYFVITDDNNFGNQVLSKIPSYLKKNSIKAPAVGGAFGKIIKINKLVQNIGGKNDNNNTLTLRLLFLMESECLLGEEIYEDIQTKLINWYVKDSITEHQICRFLLNDLIRYYRTICVDFEHKTCVQSKTWGDRNIKLLFSRKLMFFSGLLTVANTAQSTADNKRKVLKHYFNLTPIERIREICGTRADVALRLYSDFVGFIGDKNMRQILNNTKLERETHCEEFRNIKNLGQHFTWALSKLLTDTFDESHPIHIALKF